MTESMLTTRLSSVITGCGGNETTCSRRSIVARMRSTKGTTSVRPGRERARIAAQALDDCGAGLWDDRIVRARVTKTMRATMMTAITATMGGIQLLLVLYL